MLMSQQQDLTNASVGTSDQNNQKTVDDQISEHGVSSFEL